MTPEYWSRGPADLRVSSARPTLREVTYPAAIRSRPAGAWTRPSYRSGGSVILVGEAGLLLVSAGAVVVSYDLNGLCRMFTVNGIY